MFQRGRTYHFRMLEDGGDVTFDGEIEKYEHPLIKLSDTVISVEYAGGEPGSASTYPGQIINVTSPSFVSAVLKR
jgi:hypothetical protein